MDAWILLLNRESNGEFNRERYLLKARGMEHSNQVREFIMGADGIALREPYIGEGGALTGSSRRAFEAKARRAEVIRSNELLRLQQQLDHHRKKLDAQIEVLRPYLRYAALELERLNAAEPAPRTKTN